MLAHVTQVQERVLVFQATMVLLVNALIVQVYAVVMANANPCLSWHHLEKRMESRMDLRMVPIRIPSRRGMPNEFLGAIVTR